MDSDRWKKISELYGEALEVPIAERAAFLDARCGDDEVLRAELKSLLSLETKPGLLDSAIAPDEFKPGSVIAGRFRIVRLVGHGGMGEVYEAEDLHLGERVALKTIDPGVANNQNSIERFKREIQAAKKVTHPNVCRTYDVGFHPSSDDSKARIFLTMELLEGETLARRLAAGPMTTRDALPLIQQMADALGAAHKAGVIHRDFKSGNVILTPHQGGIRAVIMDFGLARMFVDSGERSGNTITQTEGVAGTPDYMAPEQLTGGAITPATDVYALGIVIYEMVTGHRPFQGHTPFDIAIRRLHEAPTSPRQLVPDLDPVWDEAILRCLASQPQDRFQSTSDLLAVLSGERSAIKVSRPWKRFGAVAGTIGLIAGVGILLLRIPKKRSTEGSAWQQLTNFSDAATDPVLSPDGRMLAFKLGGWWFINPGQIYVKLMPDGEPIQLTHDPFSKMAPVFSPDGSHIAYTVTRPGVEGWETWEASVLAGGGEPRLMLKEAEGLTWIDKHHILFSEQMGHPLMGVVTSTESLTASRQVYVPQNSKWMAHFSALSPDRKQVLVVEMQPGPATNHSDFYPCRLVPFDSASKGRVVGPVPGHCIAAAWSPNGKWMYFSARVDEKFHLWRERSEGGELEQLTSGPTEEKGLAVAPDGRSLITSVGVDRTAVWIHDANGEYQISGEGNAERPRFAADGKRVYYMWPPDLWVTELDTGRAERVLPGVSVAQYTISPDGKGIAYVTTNGSVWYGAVDRRTPPTMLASQGRSPGFSQAGDVYFWARESNTLYHVHPDGTGIHEVPGKLGDPKLEIPPFSPDEQWSLHVDNGHLLAYPREEGQPVPLCGKDCYVGWTRDRKFVWMSLHARTGQNWVTGLIPLNNKSVLPSLPAEGVYTQADLMKIPGVRLIASPAVSLAPDGVSYAFVKQESRWNLYRIPLP